MSNLRHVGTALLLVVTSALLVAQESTRVEFDVASIKPMERAALTKQGLMCGFSPSGGFRAFGYVVWFIACAYEIPPARAAQELVGLRPWMETDLFQIDATAPPEHIPRSHAEGLPMLRNLLAERFKLVMHRETRNLPAYVLVTNRRDHRLGDGLHPTSTDCTHWIESGRRGAPPASGDLPCVRQVVTATTIRLRAFPLSHLADLLTPRLGRPVHDGTGLTGYFDADVSWNVEAEDPSSGTAAMLTAVREQLGLALQSIKQDTEVLVIDHIERPSEN